MGTIETLRVRAAALIATGFVIACLVAAWQPQAQAAGQPVALQPTAEPTSTPILGVPPTVTPTPTSLFAEPTPEPTATPLFFVEATATATSVLGPQPTSSSTPTAEPTNTPSPTEEPTSRPRATSTPRPTSSTAPTATATPRPTSTPRPSPTAKPTQTAEPTPSSTTEPARPLSLPDGPLECSTSESAPLRAAIVVPLVDGALAPDLDVTVVASAAEASQEVVFDDRIPELGLLQFDLPAEMAGQVVTLVLTAEVEPGVAQERTCSLLSPGTSSGVSQDIAAASESTGELAQASVEDPTATDEPTVPLVASTPPPNNQRLIGLIGIVLLTGVVVASMVRYRLLH